TGQGEHLTFYVSGNVLTITTKEKADEKLFTRAYPVEDLLIQPQPVDRIDANVLTRGTSRTGSTGGRSGGGSFGTSGTGGFGNSGAGGGRDDDMFGNHRNRRGGNEHEDSTKARGMEMVNTIKEMVPDVTWSGNGGRSKIIYIRGAIVVTAPRSVHEALGGPI